MINDPDNSLIKLNNSDTIVSVKKAVNFFLDSFKSQNNFNVNLIDSSKGIDLRIYLEDNKWIDIFGEKKKQPFSILIGKKSMTFYFRDNHKYFNDGSSNLNIKISKTVKKGGESTIRLHNLQETKNLIDFVFNKKLGLNLNTKTNAKKAKHLNLLRYGKFSRNDLHAQTVLEKDFVEGAGKWGLHGIVKVPETKNNFVFFVTFGSKEGGHEFKEGITKEGLLTWQSQPQQRLHHPRIKDFINHDETVNSIHLLLRTDPSDDYTYLGDLKYVSHDPEVEMPVQFKWQILDWEIKKSIFDEIGLKLGKTDGSKGSKQTKPKLTKTNQLILTKELPKKGKPIKRTKNYRVKGKTDYEKKSKDSKKIGDLGEELVLKWEQEKLIRLGIHKKAIRVSLDDDSLGYDIESYNEQEQRIYIEVKTTTGSLNTPFFITPNEIEVSKEKGEQFFIYRLFNLDKELPAAEYYFNQGAVEESYDIVPTEFLAYFNSEM
ncbi:DUF3427 domain-containing protein [Algibacter mikhailovii]|uniref:DUF3427 domain-containing protein n=1 Tax=Algibacter mikhailovii TaxID=425498 RepID=UPI0024958682|nr:DUF3427 domain-containing protein [Algibacter mikhailovii]